MQCMHTHALHHTLSVCVWRKANLLEYFREVNAATNSTANTPRPTTSGNLDSLQKFLAPTKRVRLYRNGDRFFKVGMTSLKTYLPVPYFSGIVVHRAGSLMGHVPGRLEPPSSRLDFLTSWRPLRVQLRGEQSRYAGRAL